MANGYVAPVTFVNGVVVQDTMLNAIQDNIANGVMRPIAEVILSAAAATIDFSGIPATGRSLAFSISARGDTAAATAEILLRVNNDSGASAYSWQFLKATAGTPSSGEQIGASSILLGNMPAATAPAAAAGAYWTVLPNYSGTTLQKIAVTYGGFRSTAVGSGLTINIVTAHWLSTTAINRVTLLAGVGNFAAGTVCSLYTLPAMG